ncbi:arginase [Advenella kashmirensis W13003]|uniref:Arginase n=1 Tax=Advenella kashmirensis W13003 TaxID=1424334 RepID=V8QQG9_9BURK|nr:arginase family protein [Advenella kashmirensis]ETF01578.1 arginase [Advenella kashmirensis W13003]
MTKFDEKSLRLIFPLWQGGDNPPYYLGSKLLAWLAPEPTGPVEEVPVEPSGNVALPVENKMRGRSVLVRQTQAAQDIVQRRQPDSVVVLGGDCLVSLAPFAWLSERYGDKLGVLWIDSHPDVQNPEQYSNAHAHVLGTLMGQGDPDLTRFVSRPISPRNVMIAGIHSPLPHEAAFIARHGIRTCAPEAVREGAEPVMQWLDESCIEVLAIHFDLDVLDPAHFRSVLFARPGRGQDDFGNVAEGKLDISDVLQLIRQVASKKKVVGLTLAEHLPWDAVNLRTMLAQLPLLSHEGESS